MCAPCFCAPICRDRGLRAGGEYERQQSRCALLSSGPRHHGGSHALRRRHVQIAPNPSCLLRRPQGEQGRMTATRHMAQAASAFDVIIVGAGAAGLMCALTAGQRGRKVLLLDHANRVGAKILISGGGRCNFTNLHSAPDRFLSGNPDFCRSALAPLYAGGFHRAGGAPPHSLLREDARPIVLQRFRARHRGHAAGGMRARRR